MPYCANCGAAYQQGAHFCSNCGRPLGGGGMAAPQRAALAADVEAVAPRLRTDIADFVQQALGANEQVLGAFSASFFDHRREGEFRHDKFVLTDSRIIFYHTGIIHKGMDEMPFRSITGISYDKGWIHGKVIIEAANAGLTIDGIANDDALFVEKIIAGTLAGRRYVAQG